MRLKSIFTSLAWFNIIYAQEEVVKINEEINFDELGSNSTSTTTSVAPLTTIKSEELTTKIFVPSPTSIFKTDPTPEIPESTDIEEDPNIIKVVANCQDRLHGANCALLLKFCQNGENKYNAVYWCQRSCNRCDSEDVQATTKVPPLYTRPGANPTEPSTALVGSGAGGQDQSHMASTNNDKDCFDAMGSKCGFYKPLCMQPDAVKRKYFLFQCRKTCGLCGKEFTSKDLNKPTLPPITTDMKNGINRHPSMDGIQVPTTYEDLALDKNPTPKIDPNCQDLYPACKSTTGLMCESSVSVRINCPKKCKLCMIPSWLEKQEDENECQDISQIYCNTVKGLCNDVNYVPSIHVMCPITCGVGCQPEKVILPDEQMSFPGEEPAEIPITIKTTEIDNNPTTKPTTLPIKPSPTTNIPIQPPKIVSDCKDLPTCQLLTSKIYCAREIAKKNCPVLCNTCPVKLEPMATVVSTEVLTEASSTVATTIVSTTEAQKPSSRPPVTSTLPSQNTCRDNSQNCPVEWCTMPGPRKRSHVRANCRATCGFCRNTSSPANETCEDKPSEIGCPLEYCSLPGPKKVYHVQKYCRKTCGICVPNGVKPTNPAVPITTEKAMVAHFPLCNDKKPIFCQNYANENRCIAPRLKATFRRDCALSCGHCTITPNPNFTQDQQKPTQQTIISKPQPTPNPVCKDKLKACKNNKTKCFLPKYTQYMLKNCKESCGHCAAIDRAEQEPAIPAPTVTAVKPCPKDLRPKYCQTLGKNKCQAGKYAKWMKAYCQGTCSDC